MFYSDVSAMRCEIHLARSRHRLVPTNLKMYNKMCGGDRDHNGVMYYISLSLGFGIIDDRHRRPNINIREIIWLGD